MKIPLVRSFELTLLRLLLIPFHIYPTNSENMAGTESKIQNPCDRTDKNIHYKRHAFSLALSRLPGPRAVNSSGFGISVGAIVL